MRVEAAVIGHMSAPVRGNTSVVGRGRGAVAEVEEWEEGMAA